MINVNCLVCGGKFSVKLNRLKRGWGKYCSNACKHIGFKTGEYFQCDTCSKKVYKSVQEQLKSKSGKRFCSRTCQTMWRNTVYVAEKHGNWTGGQYSYRLIL